MECASPLALWKQVKRFVTIGIAVGLISDMQPLRKTIHSAFTLFRNLNLTKPYGDYNLDWTVGGLTAGEDTKK